MDTNKPNDGGPAFPAESDDKMMAFMVNRIDEKDRMPYHVITHPGMSLRDWFAGMALQGLLASGDLTGGRTINFSSAGKFERTLDQAAYDFADAMIGTRNAQ